MKRLPTISSLSTVVAASVLLFAEQAAACPSCVDPRAATSSAMLVSTAFLSLVPLAFIGSVAFWVVKRDKKSGDDDQL